MAAGRRAKVREVVLRGPDRSSSAASRRLVSGASPASDGPPRRARDDDRPDMRHRRASHATAEEPAVQPPEYVELSGVFAAPAWLRDLGFAAWLLAGVIIVLIGAVGIAALTSTIVVPVVVASILAAVLSPVVRLLERHHVPRLAGTAIVFVGVVVAGAAIVVMIVSGITSQGDNLTGKLQQAADKLQTTLKDLGVSSDSAQQAKSSASSGLSDAFHSLLDGLVTGISAF